jgi:hypothetical protein
MPDSYNEDSGTRRGRTTTPGATDFIGQAKGKFA